MLIEFDKDYLHEFTVREVFGEQIVTICHLLDISNHYK